MYYRKSYNNLRLNKYMEREDEYLFEDYFML